MAKRNEDARKPVTPTAMAQLASIIFLAGPPGSGKSSLGRMVCDNLGLDFVDVPDGEDARAQVEAVIRAGTAHVVALPWPLIQDRRCLERCRKAGEIIGLWAHPDEMQRRSGRSDPLFTPVARLKSGFGRHGTGCREYRLLARKCEYTLLLVGLSEEESAEELRDTIEELRDQEARSPAEAVGIDDWGDYWHDGLGGNAKACAIVVDAMARFVIHLKERGTSPRMISGMLSDLNMAGMLVVMYEAPKPNKALACFDGDAPEFEYRRKFSDSPRALARFASTWKAFSTWLRSNGELSE